MFGSMGTLSPNRQSFAGAYPVHELDVTRWVHAGINTLALRVHPADPRSSLSIGWVDWNPTPRITTWARGGAWISCGRGRSRSGFPQVTSALSPSRPRALRADRESGGAKPRFGGATTQRSRASWLAFRCGERYTSIPVRRRPYHFPPRAIRASISTIRRSGGRSVWAPIRSTLWRWRLPL